MSRAPVEIERALETADGDVELLRDVVTLFLTEWTSQFTALERALEKLDTAGVESGACRLQMMLENVGALEAAQLAQTLRSLGEEGRFHEGMSVLRALWEQIARVVSFYTHPDWEMEAIRIAKR
ncbi:MAG: hypothetical protein N2508_00700 [Anaerolineae bacterium]|nr:hypothetical protein [Anaerolineae bacterium]